MTIAFLVLLTAHALSPQQPRCTSDAHRQFDFWIGDWNVTDVRGVSLGTSTVERTPDGCAVSESWRGSNGVQGQSRSAFDPGDNKWHQTLMDNDGTVLVLSGGLVNGEMVLEGERELSDGTKQLERIIWTPNADGTVRQFWQSSRNAGMRWTAVFESHYRRRSSTRSGLAVRAGLGHTCAALTS
jgi:hypothetical protein